MRHKSTISQYLLGLTGLILAFIATPLHAEIYNDRFDPNRSATDQMIEYAADLGIEEHQITRAMFLGAFNPHLDDISKAFLENMSPTCEEYMLQRYEEELGFGSRLYKSFEHFKRMDAVGFGCKKYAFHDEAHNKRWNDRFGGLTDEEVDHLVKRHWSALVGRRFGRPKPEWTRSEANLDDYTSILAIQEGRSMYRSMSPVFYFHWIGSPDAKKEGFDATHGFYEIKRCEFLDRMAALTLTMPPLCEVRGEEHNTLMACFVSFIDNFSLGAADELACAADDDFASCHSARNRAMSRMRELHADQTFWCGLAGAALTPTERLFPKSDSRMGEFPRAVQAELVEAIITTYMQQDPNNPVSEEELRQQLFDSAILGLKVGGVRGAIEAIRKSNGRRR